MRVYFSPRNTRPDFYLSLSRWPQQEWGAQCHAAIRESVRLIAEHPQAWRTTDILGVRVKLVHQYPFKVFYRILEDQDEIEIMHIRHAAQRPWQGGD